MPFNQVQDGDILRVQFFCNTLTQVAVNTVHYQCVVSLEPGPDVKQIATTLDGLVALGYRSAISQAANYFGVQVYNITRAPLPIPGQSNNRQGPGAGTSPMLPGQVSGVLMLKTDFAGPRGRGRLFVPFPGAAANNVNQFPDAGYVTAIQQLGINLCTTPIVISPSSTLKAVLYHRAIPATMDKPGKPASWDPITVAKGSDQWGTQRRRGNYGRNNQIPW